jgi:predicted lipoprotein with Yx(FWY)xxD motif
MSGSYEEQIVRSSQRWPTPRLAVGIAAVTLAFAASLAAVALAGASAVTVTSASNSLLGKQIAVDAQGGTLYALSPETRRHLLCKSSKCLKFWPPLTLRSSKAKLKAGPGVHGHLAVLRRSNGVLQVTLGGLPLYHYSGDHAKGEANGQSIHSFGGRWHVLSATSNVSPVTPTGPSPTPSYGY